MRRIFLLGLVCLGVVAFVVPAQAVPFGFEAITNNHAGDPAIGEAQLWVYVDPDPADPGSSRVLFTFHNKGPEASSITDIYFDDGPLLGIASIINNMPGVAFSQGASPGNLPAGNSISPKFAATFSLDSDAPTQPNGVNPGESLGVLFNLLPDQDFDGVLAALNGGGLRIGIHVQGFASGGSESFVNGPGGEGVAHAPEPATMLLFGVGLAGFAAFRKKFKKA